jgi:predicted nucleic acid-binding protein
VITAVDTNVLLDVFSADQVHGSASRRSVRDCLRDGSLVACDVVWAEIAGAFPSSGAAERAMERLGVAHRSMDAAAALLAGDSFRRYRQRGGRRERVVADFLVGAHATAQADRLLTRDRGFYRSYFAGLLIVDPQHTHRP